jgi:hypothetical protein
MHKNINAAEILGVSRNNLQREFSDRQLSISNFNNLRIGKFDAYFPSDDIRAKFREIARNLGTSDVFISVLPTLRRMQLDMNRLKLDGSYEKNIEAQEFKKGGLVTYKPNLEEVYQEGLDLNDYLIITDYIPIQENVNIATGQPVMLQTPMPSPQIVQNQAPGNMMQNGLTATENALLSEEEKQIRLRQRGLA